MARGWYIIQTFSAHEKKVCKYIEKIISDPEMSKFILDVKVPCEDVVTMKNGERKVVQKIFLPGYVLVEMDLPELGWKNVCNRIKKVQGVLSFISASGGGKPYPITNDEARKIFHKSGDFNSDKLILEKEDFTVGDQIDIVDGPFQNFSGTVEEVHQDKGMLKAKVGIFGRPTSVEVSFMQVIKV